MDIWYGLDSVPALEKGTVVTIGVFDGVHRGHQRLITNAVEKARDLDVPCVLMTFDPHPVAVFAPERTPTMLATPAERADLVAELGVDHLLIIDFTEELAGESPQDYFRNVIVDKLNAKHVLVGQNFTFGAGGLGTSQTMESLGEQYGVGVTIVELLVDDGVRVCSTNIRNDLTAGDVRGAAEALGRRFSVTSEIERGAGRGGKELGYPTANQYFDEAEALPGDGVYAGWFTVVDEGELDGDMEPGVRYPAAISIGTNPTFGDNQRSVESFILDQDADLYGRIATVEFVEKVRDMVKFNSVDDLLVNMANDVATTRKILQLNS
ncbi:bifunctional riboflavin kinase/FAD synthetase [Corynebacterium breve]|uniref:Riboflavin biosynthesis protein n=1 Tax=Corynebacterium breve TaxID=3049799 RepID=A0ABY8VB33_9CORY|nr:bifunctional riboflavin kinase/FAD synthetase [Corynebacterium breve]WIM66826.1 bifunctional riboflavin kinase/FAD synthetase [Corynebacterium breve]